MTTSDERAELVRRTRDYIERHCSYLKQRRLEQGRGPFMIEELADALEASEAEKQRLIKIMREGLAGLETGPPTDAPYEIARLRVALKQAEEGP